MGPHHRVAMQGLHRLGRTRSTLLWGTVTNEINNIYLACLSVIVNKQAMETQPTSHDSRHLYLIYLAKGANLSQLDDIDERRLSMLLSRGRSPLLSSRLFAPPLADPGRSGGVDLRPDRVDPQIASSLPHKRKDALLRSHISKDYWLVLFLTLQ